MAFVNSCSLIDSGAGLHDDDPLWISRDAKCQQIVERVIQNGAVLVRSPPVTGKSSMVTLIMQYTKKNHANMAVYCVDFGAWNKTCDLGEYITKSACDWDEAWRNSPTCQQRTLFLLDETQVLYELGKRHAFWQMIRKRMNSQNTDVAHVFVVLFATYGERPDVGGDSARTPVSFTHAFGLDFLLFTEAEHAQQIGRAHV